jgi:energy-coupling factor transport system ATP-binding protein
MSDGKIKLDGTVDEVYSQGELLSSLGLDIPEITSVFLKLKQAGFDLGKTEYTVEGAKKSILTISRKGECYDKGCYNRSVFSR